MNKTFRYAAFAAVLSAFGSAHAVNILQNPGFETGDISGWTSSAFTATNNDSHSGKWSAIDNGNFNIEQDFSAVDTSQITEVSLWIKQPFIGATYINAIDLIYSDASVGEFLPLNANAGGWAQQNVTADLAAGKQLTGIRLWGYSQGTNHDTTLYDDVVVNVNAVPEPASMAILGLGVAAMIRRRRNRSA